MDHLARATASSASSTRVVDVLVPVALNQTYSYRVPRGMELKPGDVVACRSDRARWSRWCGRKTPIPIRACTIA